MTPETRNGELGPITVEPVRQDAPRQSIVVAAAALDSTVTSVSSAPLDVHERSAPLAGPDRAEPGAGQVTRTVGRTETCTALPATESDGAVGEADGDGLGAGEVGEGEPISSDEIGLGDGEGVGLTGASTASDPDEPDPPEQLAARAMVATIVANERRRASRLMPWTPVPTGRMPGRQGRRMRVLRA